MDESIHIDDALLLRLIDGDTTDEELAAVKLWLAADPSHRRELDGLCAIDFACSLLRDMPNSAFSSTDDSQSGNISYPPPPRNGRFTVMPTARWEA